MDQNNAQKTIDDIINRVPKKELTKLVKAASKAHTAQDIKDIAAGFGQTLTDEQAELLLNMYGEEVQLSPDFLDTVSGGASRAESFLC